MFRELGKLDAIENLIESVTKDVGGLRKKGEGNEEGMHFMNDNFEKSTKETKELKTKIDEVYKLSENVVGENLKLRDIICVKSHHK